MNENLKNELIIMLSPQLEEASNLLASVLSALRIALDNKKIEKEVMKKFLKLVANKNKIAKEYINSDKYINDKIELKKNIKKELELFNENAPIGIKKPELN